MGLEVTVLSVSGVAFVGLSSFDHISLYKCAFPMTSAHYYHAIFSDVFG